MSKTYYIDCNKSLSNDKDNIDNSQFTTQLKESITLPIGSEISIQSSFINQQGITGDSIEIEEDIIEEIKYMYYKTDTQNIIPNNDITSVSDHPYKQFNFSKGSTGAETRAKAYDLTTAGEFPNGAAQLFIEDLFNAGATEQPMILMDYVENAGTALADIAVGTSTINIKKGVYGITQLADIITAQINDVKDSNFNQTDPISKKVIDGTFDEADLSYPGNKGTFKRLVIPDTSYAPTNIQNAQKPVGQDYIFTDVKTANAIRESRRDLNDGTGILWLNALNNTGAGLNAFNNVFAHPAAPTVGTPVTAVLEYNPLRFGFYTGTPFMSIDYNSDNSSYELNGLHMPYTFPSHDMNLNEQVLKGKEGVFYKKQTFDGTASMTQGMSDAAAKKRLVSSLMNPMTRYGGIIIFNFAFNTAVKFGTKPNLTVEQVKERLLYKEFFNNENEAKEAWKKSLWHKLGFTYDQFNNEGNFENVRYYNQKISDSVKLQGITTNTILDPSVIQTISSKTSSAHFAATSSTPQLSSGTLETFGIADTNFTGIINGGGTAGYFVNSIYNVMFMLPIEASGRAITAFNLPILSTVGYYLITSDILDGYNDIVKDGSPLALLGVVAKSSLSNQDFIYSSQDITNLITNEKIINKIKIKFLKPDLTSPDLESNSSVILRIDIPAPQPAAPKKPLQKEEDKK